MSHRLYWCGFLLTVFVFSAEEGVLRAAAGSEVTARADQVEGQAHPAARGRGSTPAGGVVWAGGEQLLTYLPSLHLPPLTQSTAPTGRIVWARGEQLLTTAVISLDPDYNTC